MHIVVDVRVVLLGTIVNAGNHAQIVSGIKPAPSLFPPTKSGVKGKLCAH